MHALPFLSLLIAQTPSPIVQAGEPFWQPEVVNAVAAVLTAIFSLVTLLSLHLLRRQIKADHERSRRERAVELMTFYANNESNVTNHEVIFGLRLIHSLTPDQCHATWDRQTFTINKQNLALLMCYRAACAPKTEYRNKPGVGLNTSLELTLPEILTLRAIATHTLNKLEMIASAWCHYVADREIIQQEFVKVFCPKPGTFVMENFRAASGVYPSIAKLCDFYRVQNQNGTQIKAPIA